MNLPGYLERPLCLETKKKETKLTIRHTGVVNQKVSDAKVNSEE